LRRRIFPPPRSRSLNPPRSRFGRFLKAAATLARLQHDGPALAAALGEHEGPQAGLAELDRIDPARIFSYQPWWAVRAHLLVGAGDADAASTAYDRAIALSSADAVRAFLVRRKMEAALRYR
jgi:predicted RNA polymerase sigma factor